jgi:hypothetical protein
VSRLRRQCAGRPFADPEFGGPRGVGTAAESGKWDVAPTWARMSEMSTTPAIVDRDGFSPDSLTQGSLGDCWFISALSALASANDASFLKNLFLTPEIDPTGAGVYAVRLWKNGNWVEIILDDRFPVRKGAYWDAKDQTVYAGGGLGPGRLGTPVFLKSRSHNEFWGMMLEKALAKYYGGYSKIEGGFVHLALCDMIPGSIGEDIDLTSGPVRSDIASGKFWSKLLRFYQQGFILGELNAGVSSMYCLSTRTLRALDSFNVL